MKCRLLFTTPKVLRRREIIEMDRKRRRSERGPISLAVRALLELPDTIIEEILRGVGPGIHAVRAPTDLHAS